MAKIGTNSCKKIAKKIRNTVSVEPKKWFLGPQKISPKIFRAHDDREVYCRNHVPNATPHDPTLPLLPSSPSSGSEKNGGTEAPPARHRPDAGLQDMKIAVKCCGNCRKSGGTMKNSRKNTEKLRENMERSGKHRKMRRNPEKFKKIWGETTKKIGENLQKLRKNREISGKHRKKCGEKLKNWQEIAENVEETMGS